MAASEASPPPVPTTSAGTACSYRPARPQMLGSREVWPEHWGLERRQVSALLDRLRSDAAWEASNDVYCLVKDFVVPWTRGSGLSYALQLNSEAPKEVTLMVSHAWAENAEAFLEALLRASTEGDVLFVCALCIYQAEDGCGPSVSEQLGSEPSESPFRRVLEHIRAKGSKSRCWWRPYMLAKAVPELLFVVAVVLFYLPALRFSCVPSFVDLERCSRAMRHSSSFFLMDEVTWEQSDLPPRFRLCMPLSLSLIILSLLWKLALRQLDFYEGRMVVVPNREVDVYSRLWCVYEIFVALQLGVPVRLARSLALAGKVRSRDAVCGSERDAERIRGEMALGGYSCEYIDKVVYLVTHRARMECLRTLLTYGLAIAVADAAVVCAWRAGDSRFEELQTFLALMLGIFLGSFAVCSVFQAAQGKPSFRRVLLCGCFQVFSGFSLFLLLRWHETLSWACWALLLTGVDTLFLTLVGVLCCTAWGKRNCRKAVLLGCTLLAVCLLSLKSAAGRLAEADLVHNATLALVHFWVPGEVWWSSALLWGVTIERRHCGSPA